MIKPKNNSFYIKQQVAETDALKLSALFKDAALYESASITLQGGADAAKFVLTGSIPPQPIYGDTVLSGADLVFFCSGSDLSNMGRMPMVSSYKLKEDITLTEGGMAFSTPANGTAGNKLAVFTSYVDPSQPFLAETFDGIPKDMGGNVDVVGSDGTGPVMLGSPYMSASDAARSVYLGGTYSIFHAGETNEGGSAAFMRQFFGVRLSGGSPGTTGGEARGGAAAGGEDVIIPCKPQSKKNIQGKWVPSADKRTSYAKFTVFKPIWRWNDIKGLLKFRKTTAASREQAPPTEINTVFQILHKTPDNQTSFTSSPDGDPWATSELDMSSIEYKTGGQSLHMAHLWDTTSGTPDTEQIYGETGSSNAQYAVAGGDILPYPLPLDYARLTTSGTAGVYTAKGLEWNSVAAGAGGPSTLSKPQMDIGFKITELAPCLSAYGGDSASYDLRVYDWIGWKSAAPGTGFAYTGEHRGSGFLLNRSFTITLSSYAPKQGENLDRFIDRGMTNFYVHQKYSEGIIGGVSFVKFVGDAQSVSEENPEGELIIASPLLTRSSAYKHYPDGAGNTTNFGAGEINPNNRMRRLITGTNGSDSGTDAKLILNPQKIYPVSGGHNRAIQPEATGTTAEGSDFAGTGFGRARWEPSIAISPDQWVNMKIVLDPLGENNGALPGLGRVFFTEGVHESNPDVPFYDEDKPPSLQLYFPASTSTGGAVGGTQWPYLNDGDADNGNWNWVDKPEYWPRYVCLWLQNYKYASSTDYKFGKSSAAKSILVGEFPSTGAAKTAEVFVDNVTLSNFSNEVLNNSAGASYLTKPISIRDRPVQNYLDVNGMLAFPESAGQGSTGTMNQGATTYTLTSTPVTAMHAPTYVSIGFEKGVLDLPNRFTVSGTAGDLPGAYMFLSGFSTPTFSNLQCQDRWTTHASFMSLSGTGIETQAGGFGDVGNTRQSTNRMGFWGINRGAVATPTTYTGTNLVTANAGSMRSANPNSRYNKLKIVLSGGTADLHSAITGSQDPNFTYAGGFLLASGTNNDFLSTDGLTQKGFMKFIANTGSNRMVKDADENGNWCKLPNPLLATKIIGLPSFDPGSEDGYFTNRAVIVDNPEIFNEATLGDTSYMIFTASGGILTSGNITNPNTFVAGKKTAHIQQERAKQDNVVFFNSDVRGEAGANAICTAANLPYLWVAPVKYWVNMEIFPGHQLKITGAKKNLAPYISGSTGSDKVYDGICTMGGTSTDDDDVLGWTGSTYNEELFFYNAGARDQIGRSQNYGQPWSIDPTDPLVTSLVTDVDYGFGAFDEESQTGGQAAVTTAFQQKQLILNFDKVIEADKPPPAAPFGVTVELYEPSATHTVSLYGNDYAGLTPLAILEAAQLKPYFAYRYYDELNKVTDFKIEPSINLLNQEDLYKLPEESRNAIKFSWATEGDDLWYTMINAASGNIASKYNDAFFWAPLNEQPTSPTGAVEYIWYNMDNSRNLPTKHDEFVIMSGSGGPTASNTLFQTIEGLAGYAPAFGGKVGCLEASGVNVINPVDRAGVDELPEFTFICHALPDAAADNQYYFWQVSGQNSAPGGNFVANVSGGFAVWMDSTGITHAQMGASSSADGMLAQGHMQSITKNTLDGTMPHTVAVTYNSGSLTGPDFKLYINGKLEDYVRDGVPYPRCSGQNIVIGSGCAGTMEEVLLYNKEIYFPQTEGEFFLDTSDLLDKGSNDKAITYQARLFAFDYHNIRGEDPLQVAQSKPVSWRISSV